MNSTNWLAPFRDGRAQPTRNTDIQADLRRLQTTFPAMGKHLEAFSLLGCEVTWVRSDGPIKCNLLVKPGRHFSAATGIFAEFLLTYVDHPDFQRRDYTHVHDALNGFGNRAFAGLAYVFSRDIRLQDKCRNWAERESVQLVALPAANNQRPQDVARRVFEHTLLALARRNLYDYTTPVTGEQFFGRERLLVELAAKLREGRAIGVFGLRKTGKTSVIRELGRRFEAGGDARLFVFEDLEGLPSGEINRVPQLTQNLAEQLRAGLSQLGMRTHELSRLGPDTTPQDLKRAMDATLSDKRAHNLQILVALDEVESLVGTRANPTADPQVGELLGVIRAMVQTHANFNVLLAGLADSIAVSGQIAGRENPFFAWAVPYYLGAFDPLSARDMLTRIGKRMALEWTEGALSMVISHTGGHVYILRSFAGFIANRLITEIDRRTIDRPLVEDSVFEWDMDMSPQMKAIGGGLSRYYPDEWALLQLLASKDVEPEALPQDFPDETRVLTKLGFIQRDASGIRVTRLAEMIV